MMKSPEVVEWCIKKLSSLPSKEYRDLYRMIVTYYKQYHDINESDFITYVLDKEEKLYGVIELRDLIIAREKDNLDDIIKKNYPYFFDNEKIKKSIGILSLIPPSKYF